MIIIHGLRSSANMYILSSRIKLCKPIDVSKEQKRFKFICISIHNQLKLENIASNSSPYIILIYVLFRRLILTGLLASKFIVSCPGGEILLINQAHTLYFITTNFDTYPCYAISHNWQWVNHPTPFDVILVIAFIFTECLIPNLC